MPTRDTRSWSPWKILLVAVLGCAFAFGFLVLAAVYWVTSARQQQEKTVESGVAQRRRVKAPRLNPPPMVEDRNDTRQVGGAFTNTVTTARTEPHSVSPAPAGFAKNEILGSRASGASSLPGDDLFKEAQIPSLQIKIPPEGIAGLNRSARRYVRATIQEGAIIYTNVAIHLKGGPGSYRQLRDVPSFTVNFDRFAPSQTFHGLKKIHLNNSVQDRSYLSEKISRELFEAAGVPAPRAGNAKVTFNGRELGIYVLVEGVNKQFLKRYFKDAKGTVFDGHSGTDVTAALPTNTEENAEGHSRLRALAAATQEPDLDTRLEKLEKTLDLDRFLSFVAMEMILWHWDGYTMNRNNFRIYHDRDTDRMVFLPQGVDQILSKTDGTLFPQNGQRMAGLVTRSVLQIPEARRRYRERVAQLSTNVFKAGAINDRIHEVAEKIQPILAEMDSQAANSFSQRVRGLCQRVHRRASYLQDQFSPASPVTFGNLGIAPLTDWKDHRDLGNAELTREKDPEGNIFLRISTRDGCTASWRTRTQLDSGLYRFEARIKTQGVILTPDDPRAGAGLRVSRYRKGQKNSGDRDWTPAAFDFEVSEDQSEVELVCELRATQGDIWFDLKSLKIKRR